MKRNFKNFIIGIISILGLGAHVVSATTILPLSIEDQIRNSDIVARGVVKGQTFKRLPSGDIVTEVSLDLSGVSSRDEVEVINPSQFKFFVPGGVWGDIRYKVDGAPSFTDGEDVVLILNKFKFGLKLSSLGLSKYHVLNKYDKSVVLRSDLFPEHPTIGIISYAEFSKLLLNINSKDLEPIKNEKTVWKRPVESIGDSDLEGRAPASEGPTTGFEMGWLILILGVLGSGSWVLAKKE